MSTMRRANREVKGLSSLQEIIALCKVCRVAILDDPFPYIVPLNFGYSLPPQDRQLTLFFHCATQGRKIDLLQKNPNVAFEMDCGHKLAGEGEKACAYTYHYASIIGEGEMEFVTDSLEKRQCLISIMEHQVGPADYSFDDAVLDRTCVMRLRVSRFSGKQNC